MSAAANILDLCKSFDAFSFREAQDWGGFSTEDETSEDEDDNRALFTDGASSLNSNDDSKYADSSTSTLSSACNSDRSPGAFYSLSTFEVQLENMNLKVALKLAQDSLQIERGEKEYMRKKLRLLEADVKDRKEREVGLRKEADRLQQLNFKLEEKQSGLRLVTKTPESRYANIAKCLEIPESIVNRQALLVEIGSNIRGRFLEKAARTRRLRYSNEYVAHDPPVIEKVNRAIHEPNCVAGIALCQCKTLKTEKDKELFEDMYRGELKHCLDTVTTIYGA